MSRKRRSVFLILMAVLITTLGFTGCQSTKTEKTFRLGIIPSENAQETLKSFSPLVSYLEESMGMKVEASVATDYNAVVEAMRSGHIDAGMFGPFSYIMAQERAGAEVVLARVGANGSPTYDSYFYTLQDSGIKEIEDLKGKSFAFTDPGSTSGYLIPSKVLLDHNITTDDFSDVIYTNGHDASILAVKNGSVNAACGDEMSYARALEKGVITENELNVFYKASIPQSPFAVSKDIDPEIKQKFIDAMLVVHEKNPEALEPLSASKYVEVTDENYQIIRDTAEALGVDLSKMQ